MIQLIIIMFLSFIGLFTTYRILNTKWKETACGDAISERFYKIMARDTKILFNEDVFKFVDAKATLTAKVFWLTTFIVVCYFFTPFFVWVPVGGYMMLTSRANKIDIANTKERISGNPSDITSLMLYGKRVIYYYQIFLTVLFYLYIIIR